MSRRPSWIFEDDGQRTDPADTADGSKHYRPWHSLPDLLRTFTLP